MNIVLFSMNAIRKRVLLKIYDIYNNLQSKFCNIFTTTIINISYILKCDY